MELGVQGVELHAKYLASYGLEIAWELSRIFSLAKAYTPKFS